MHLILLGHSGVVLQSLVYDDMNKTESDCLGAQKPEYALMYFSNCLISGRKEDFVRFLYIWVKAASMTWQAAKTLACSAHTNIMSMFSKD